MNIRKVLAGSLAAIAAGATLTFGAFAVLGDYVPDSTMPLFVIGDDAKSPDTLGLTDIAVAMAGYATMTTSVGAGAVTAVSGGADLSTANTNIYLGDGLNAAKNTLTKSDLSTLLASGSAYDESGTEYKYDQYINLGSRTITYDKSGGDLDEPTLYIDVGTTATAQLYNATIVFNKAINISNTNVKGKSTVTFLGNEYTVGAESSITTLVLYGGANKHTISEGETATITVGGVEHNAKVVGVSNSTQAVIEVDGVSKEVNEGTSYTINGDKGKIDVYIDAVWYFGKEAQVSSVRLSLGSAKMTLKTGDKVKMGTENTGVDGTVCALTFTSATSGELSKIVVEVAADDTDTDHIAEDAAFVDPVFGTFKTAFGGATPALDDTARTTTTVDSQASDKVSVKYTDYRGNEKEFVFVYDTDTTAGGVTPILADGNGKRIHVVEGADAAKNEYVVLSQGDFSHLYKVADIDDIGSSDAKIELKDVFDDSIVEILPDATTNQTTAYIDGQAYTVKSNPAGTLINFTWTPAATTVFPLLGGANGEAIALLWNATGIANDTMVILPGDPTDTTGTKINASFGAHAITQGQLKWNVTSVSASSEIWGVYVNGVTVHINNSPALLLFEEQANSNAYNGIVVSTSETGTSDNELTVSTARFSDTAATSFISSTADTKVSMAMDKYGVHVTKDTDDDGTITITYPDTQAYYTIGIGADPIFTTAGGAEQVEAAVKITTPVSKLASEVSTSALTTDIVLVGGPCANSLVAELMNVSMAWPDCNVPFEALSKGIIKEYDDAFGSGKKALVVAGTTAANTRDLASDVMKGTLSYEA